VRIDHVIYGTADLDVAAARVQAELGLTAVAGGRHDGIGTHNRIVALGDGSFLELLAVADPREASGSEVGAALQSAIARGTGCSAGRSQLRIWGRLPRVWGRRSRPSDGRGGRGG
jgi:hypothetical protein